MCSTKSPASRPIHLLGRPFSEPTLIRLAYAYEQATHHRLVPTMMPALDGEVFTYR